MGKNQALIVLSLLVAIHAIVGICPADAQYTQDGNGFPIAGPLNILSPANTTFNSCPLLLNVTSKFLLSPSLASFRYSLDGGDNVTLPIEGRFVPIEAVRTYANGTTEKCISSIFSYYILCGDAELPMLANGSHWLTVFAEYLANGRVGLDKREVYFTVADNLPSVGEGNHEVQSSISGKASVVDPTNLSSATSIQSPIEPKPADSIKSPQETFLGIAVSGFAVGIAFATVLYIKKCRRRSLCKPFSQESARYSGVALTKKRNLQEKKKRWQACLLPKKANNAWPERRKNHPAHRFFLLSTSSLFRNRRTLHQKGCFLRVRWVQSEQANKFKLAQLC